jgi:hypothetical protein
MYLLTFEIAETEAVAIYCYRGMHPEAPRKTMKRFGHISHGSG